MINTRLSTEIEINQKIFKDLVLNIKKEKELTMEKEIEEKIDLIIKKVKIDYISKYMSSSFNIKAFPFEH